MGERPIYIGLWGQRDHIEKTIKRILASKQNIKDLQDAGYQYLVLYPRVREWNSEPFGRIGVLMGKLRGPLGDAMTEMEINLGYITCGLGSDLRRQPETLLVSSVSVFDASLLRVACRIARGLEKELNYSVGRIVIEKEYWEEVQRKS